MGGFDLFGGFHALFGLLRLLLFFHAQKRYGDLGYARLFGFYRIRTRFSRKRGHVFIGVGHFEFVIVAHIVAHLQSGRFAVVLPRCARIEHFGLVENVARYAHHTVYGDGNGNARCAL